MSLSDRLQHSHLPSPVVRPDYRADKAHVCSVCHCRGEDPDDVEFDDQDEFVEHWDNEHW